MNPSTMKSVICACLALFGANAYADDIAPSLTQYAVFSGGNVSMNGRAIVTGHLGASGTLSLQDSSEISEGAYSSGAMTIRYRVRVDGPAHSDQTIYIYDDTVMGDSVQSGGSMTLRYRVRVGGDATSSASITSMSGVVVQGSTSQYAELPDTWTPPTVAEPSYSPGSTGITVGNNQSRAITPGAYGDLLLRSGASVSLSAGVYRFSRVTSESDTRFLIDDSAGPVEIYVEGQMLAGYRSRVVIDSGMGSNLSWSIGGSLTVQTDSSFAGLVRCFSGVTLQDRISTDGSIYARGDFSCGWDCVLSVASPTTTFYVATSGNDANAGTSMTAPLRTIQAAIVKCVEPGSTIYIAPGEYIESLEVGTGAGQGAVSGEIDNPTRVIADTTGQNTNRSPGAVVLQGSGVREDGVTILGVDYWQIDGLTIDGFTEYGIRCTNSAPSITGCAFDVPARYAIHASVDTHFEASDNRFVTDLSSGGLVWVEPSTGVSGIEVTITGNDGAMRAPMQLTTGFHDGSVYQQESSEERFTEGIVVQGDRNAFGRVEISNNQLTDLAMPILYNNRNGNNAAHIVNNTVVGCYYSIYVSASEGQAQIGVHNNIVDQCYYGLITQVGTGSTLEVSGLLEHDIAYNMSGFGRPYEFDIITGDPRFHEPEIGDFSLWSNSPAVDTGSAQYAPGTDIGGRSRPIDGDGDGVAQADLGAYEQVFEGGGEQVRVVQWREIGAEDDR